MDSRSYHETLQKYYQLPGKNIINRTDMFYGRDTDPKLFLLDRGGNCSFIRDIGNISEGFKNTNKQCNRNKEFQFMHGDRILHEDYFKGWNDSYFFQTNIFRNNPSLWLDPFRSNYFQRQ